MPSTDTLPETARTPQPAAPTDLASFPDAAAYRRRRAAGDLYGRSLVGPVFYAVGCLVTTSVAGYFQPLRVVAWLPAVMYLVLYFLRRSNRPPDSVTDTRVNAAWRRRHWAMIHGGCLLWGCVFVYVSLTERGYGTGFMIAVICSVMFGAALSQAFSMDKRQTMVTLGFLYVPALAVIAPLPALRPVAITLVAFIAYCIASLRRLAAEYDAQISTEYALRLSRTEIEKLVRLDTLTGLANRREYEQVFPNAWQQGVRQHGDLSLLVLDIDHFKKLNDGYRHLAGDACLQHFANLMRKSFRREIDLLARIGGEEFVVMLPGSSLADAARIAESFRLDVERSPCVWAGQELPMTVSVGVGSADWSMDPKPDATFARIDQACYEAKTMGRNRVIIAEALRVGHA